jgi:hypothetical protein
MPWFREGGSTTYRTGTTAGIFSATKRRTGLAASKTADLFWGWRSAESDTSAIDWKGSGENERGESREACDCGKENIEEVHGD